MSSGRYNTIVMNGLDALVAHIHPVDRQATRVWCALFDTHPSVPVSLMALQMFYGARYWSKVRRAITSHSATGVLEDDVLHVAEAATRTTRVDRDQLVGITLAGLMVAELPDAVALPNAALLETPTMVLRRRARNTPEGLFGRFSGDRRRWRVTIEPDPTLTYVVSHGEPLAPCRGGNHEQCRVGILAGSDPHPVIRHACETPVLGRVSIVELFAAS